MPLDEHAREQHLPLAAECELAETGIEAEHGSQSSPSRPSKQPAPEDEQSGDEPERDAAADATSQAGG